MIIDDLLSSIGNTPLIRAEKIRPEGGAEIYFKLESYNLTGSVKARAARNMIIQAEREGLLSPNQKIVEPSSGNLGIALAAVCKELNRECILVVDPRMTSYTENIMRAYGARVEYVYEPDEYNSWQGSRLKRAKEIAEEENGYMCFQYANPNNPKAHYQSTGMEIIEQLGDSPDACVVGISTGGQITGTGKRLKDHNGNCKMIGVDVQGSSILGDKYVPYHLRGLGLSWWPLNLDPEVIDCMYQINEELAFNSSKILAKREGILSGGSAGAIVAATIKESLRLGPSKKIVAIIPERGDRYLNQFYNDDWLKNLNYRVELNFEEFVKKCYLLNCISEEKLHKASLNRREYR